MTTKQVWKWELEPPTDLITIHVPKGTEFLTAREQGYSICVWGLVDMESAVTDQREERTLRIAGTGHNIANGNFKYLGSAHLERGLLVFHVFECL